MYIDSLMIEVTRRCNMKCEHCLRGNAQPKDLDLIKFKKICKQLEYSNVGILILTGGEPTLVPKIMDDVLNLLQHYHIKFSSFWMSTNAKRINDKVIRSLLQYKNNVTDMFNIQVSTDQYHDVTYKVRDNIDKLEVNLGYMNNESLVHQAKKRNNIIRDGRAKNWGYIESTVSHWYTWNECKENDIEDGIFYININGSIFKDCDLSYESQRKKKKYITDYNDENLITTIQKNIEIYSNKYYGDKSNNNNIR